MNEVLLQAAGAQLRRAFCLLLVVLWREETAIKFNGCDMPLLNAAELDRFITTGQAPVQSEQEPSWPAQS
jgi:hypothetical protein